VLQQYPRQSIFGRPSEASGGLRGESRRADVIGNAVRVMRIATGEEPDDRQDAPAPSPAQRPTAHRPSRLRCGLGTGGLEVGHLPVADLGLREIVDAERAADLSPPR
jgi:hypothetical protein